MLHASPGAETAGHGTLEGVRTTLRRPLSLLVAGVLLCAGCTSSSSGTESPEPAGTGQTAVSPDAPAHSATIDGLTRTWSVYSPPAVADDPSAPLLLVMHGTGDTGQGIRTGIGPDLERLADRDGFRVAYVDGYENNWNECRVEGDWPAKEQGLDDVGLMRAVVSELGATGPVHALGFSSGGHMAMRLALEAPDLVDAVAVVAANPPAPDNQSCADAGAPVPVMFLQTREDRINPVDGGEVSVGSGPFARSRGEVVSAAEGARWYAERNGIVGPAPKAVRDGDAETTTWDGDHPVRLVVVDHADHSFPTLSGRWGQDGGARYDGPGEIWRFLSAVNQG